MMTQSQQRQIPNGREMWDPRAQFLLPGSPVAQGDRERQLREVTRSLVAMPPCGKRQPDKEVSPPLHTHIKYTAVPVMISTSNCQICTIISSWQLFPFATCNYVFCFISKKTIFCPTAQGIPSFLPRATRGSEDLEHQCHHPSPRTSWVMALHGTLGERTPAKKLEAQGRRLARPLRQQGITAIFSRWTTYHIHKSDAVQNSLQTSLGNR